MSRHSQSLANWQALSDQLPESCLRIASYNVHGCRGTDGRKDASRIAGVIAELECDTVGLQEVDYRLDYIAGRLGMQAVPGLMEMVEDPQLDRDSVRYGYRALREITDVTLPDDARQWRAWYAAHGIETTEKFRKMERD